MLNIFSCFHLTSVSSLVKCFFLFFAHFPIGLLAFLLLSIERFYMSSIWILCQICSIQIFSPSMYLGFFIILTRSSAKQKVSIFIKSNFLISSFMDCAICFQCIGTLHQGPIDFPLRCLLKVLQCYVLHLNHNPNRVLWLGKGETEWPIYQKVFNYLVKLISSAIGYPLQVRST